MFKLRKEQSVLGLLVLAALVSAYFLLTMKQPEASSSSDTTASSYGEQIQNRSYNLHGDLAQHLTAVKQSSYKAKHSSTFFKPVLTSYAPDHTHWVMHALHATRDSKTQILNAWGNVKIEHFDLKNNNLVTIQSSRMIYHGLDHIAYTNQPVTITRPGSVTHGVGMIANLKTGNYTLLSHNHITYLPTPKKTH